MSVLVLAIVRWCMPMATINTMQTAGKHQDELIREVDGDILTR